jgi:Pyruvate/2-oxoacid:ferredoxin oxidoreductase delta subunit
MAGRLTRRSLLAGSWLRPAPAGPADWVPQAAPPAPSPAAREARRVLAVAAHRCLDFCQVCVERCPRPGALVPTARGPRLDAARCDGCGICLDACPSPGRPLSLVPEPAPA